MVYRYTIIILYCVNCKFSLHLVVTTCYSLSVLYIVILCTRPVSFTSNSVCGRIVTKESEDHQEREGSVN